jgi:hypothetical protein
MLVERANAPNTHIGAALVLAFSFCFKNALD